MTSQHTLEGWQHTRQQEDVNQVSKATESVFQNAIVDRSWLADDKQTVENRRFHDNRLWKRKWDAAVINPLHRDTPGTAEHVAGVTGSCHQSVWSDSSLLQ